MIKDLYKYTFEDEDNFYYTNNISYKYLEYTAEESDPRMTDTVKLVSVEETTTFVFNKEKQKAESVYQVGFMVNCSGQKYLTNCTESDLINKLGFTIVAKREPPIEPMFKGFEVLLDNIKTKNNGEI